MPREGARRHLLLDTDVLVILAGSELLGAVLDGYGIELADCRRLAAVPHQLRRSRRLQQQYSPEFRLAALRRVEAIQPVEGVGDPRYLDVLARARDCDEGEALLFAIAAESGAAIATGDMRAVRAVGLVTGGAELRQRLVRSILTLESALFLAATRLGVGAVYDALGPVAEHRTIRVLRGSQSSVNEEEFFAGLRSYIRSHDQEIGHQLIWIPEDL